MFIAHIITVLIHDIERVSWFLWHFLNLKFGSTVMRSWQSVEHFLVVQAHQVFFSHYYLNLFEIESSITEYMRFPPFTFIFLSFFWFPLNHEECISLYYALTINKRRPFSEEKSITLHLSTPLFRHCDGTVLVSCSG